MKYTRPVSKAVSYAVSILFILGILTVIVGAFLWDSRDISGKVVIACGVFVAITGIFLDALHEISAHISETNQSFQEQIELLKEIKNK